MNDFSWCCYPIPHEKQSYINRSRIFALPMKWTHGADDGGQSKHLLIGFHSTTPRPLIQIVLSVLLTGLSAWTGSRVPPVPSSIHGAAEWAGSSLIQSHEDIKQTWRVPSQLTRTVQLHAEKSDWHILDFFLFFFFKSSAALLNQACETQQKMLCLHPIRCDVCGVVIAAAVHVLVHLIIL